MDYGHELVFGTFLTPAVDNPDRVIALAQLTEQVGLDLVSFQDHPYQPRLMDAWTLLSVVAAHTERVKVTTNVANLPLRHPVVLARSVATLDLITNGRVELGLGAGGFLDAVAANGGPRLTTGQSIAALEEAIAIMREVWTPGGGGIRLAGKHYTVSGAKRGPAPAHDVSIWLGAYKPRMLALTGRLADGWLPSSGYAGPEELAAMNKIIDEAAVEAGRDPAAVRRLYNISGAFGGGGRFLQGPQELWIDQLTELTLGEGMSTYILASDNPDDIRRFAEVAAGVRDAVAVARSGAVAAGRVVATGFGVVPTPAPAVRRSAVQLLDESARPTGPAQDPSRTYTPYQLQSGQHLIDVHDHLRAELDQVRDLVEQVAAGTLGVGAARSHINTMTMRQNNWTLGTYCESYCRLVTTHHSLEDASLFPHLRRADPDLVPVVDRLQEEHKVIHDVLEGVDKALVALVDGSGDIDGLRAAVDLLDDTLLSHLSYEERELVEPLARLGVL
ncbi:alkanesulfonate monooxygenase SsuD/methylene tetrahydromethanopterin reductase-like flavin-dependent oxidoreductase (luciferase family) [Kribbella sp. VKM Ac-2569]|uniref:LLM class flavin-dependent oxidoreductase n=1 Tax=Kribbella sp. VKM Ac-2569 TaxID=2512220 RepID=UPI00102BBA3A|nr:LLM class flavin-dependent oxidoreductase [Kribbella sp. VKM Ac-2569]RZT07410.1 alkanesulfonate monooxygenase SsuD/methylene tetrahydromethanopterin reductase-like flavin-dependent oxidoreductase (luciferase family) [Kribbella sp. VKM Ac-2569]